MSGIIKNSLLILIPFWIIYIVFYCIDIKYHTIFIMPLLLIIFIYSLLYLSKIIVEEEHKFKKKYHLSTYAYLYYSIIIFLIFSFIFIFIFDSICKNNNYIFNIYINEGATDKFLYFLSSFYYYIKILFPILLVIITLIRRKKFRNKNKKNRR